MSMCYTLLDQSIWYHSEHSDVPYFPNQFLGLDFFCHFLQQNSFSFLCTNHKKVIFSMI